MTRAVERFGFERGIVVILCAGVLGALLATGVFALFGLESSEAGRDELLISEVAGELRELQSALVDERQKRSELELQLSNVRSELSRMAAFAEAAANPPGEDALSADASEAESGVSDSFALGRGSDESGAAKTPIPAFDLDEKPWFDSGALASAGVSAREVERLKSRWEEYEMERLYLQDEIVRSGGRHGSVQDRYELEQQIREELGDEDYDKLLFASGQSNRVMVHDVLETSPGFRAGLEKGDTILAYNGERIFRPRDLKQAISGANEGSSVWIELLGSDGVERNIHIASGPIGIKMIIATQAPVVR